MAPFEVFGSAHSGAFKKKVHSAESMADERAKVVGIDSRAAKVCRSFPNQAQLGQAAKRHDLQVGGAQVTHEKPKWPYLVERLEEFSHLRYSAEFAGIVFVTEYAKAEVVQIVPQRSALR